ncbi:hypothetical protein HDU79_009992 [Rhizoclosmatium sp. JEL0117]|nr:hypothetical protein HDU79_009992 [Rhizoclosmatium sp. JEL0117]
MECGDSSIAPEQQPIRPKPKAFDVDWKALAVDIEAIRVDWNVPGLAVGVVHKGRLVFEQGFGVKNEKGDEVTPETLFQIGSTTKAFTSLAIGMLVDEGKLNWKTKVTTLTDTCFKDPITNQQANFIDILSHRTGLPRYEMLLFSNSDEYELLSKLAHLEPSAEFRERYQYNNHMFTLAGVIAGNVSGLGTWNSVIETKILKPLGMDDTITQPENMKDTKNHARGFSLTGGILEQLDWSTSEWMNASKGAGAIVSNIRDFAKWAALINRKGKLENGNDLISATQFAMLTTPHMPIGSPVTGGIKDLTSYRVLFPDMKIDWNKVYKKKEAMMRDIASIERKKRVDARKEDTKHSFPLSAYEGTCYHPGFGDAIIKLELESKFFHVSIGDKRPTNMVVGHWEKDVFGVFELQDGYRYKDYELPLFEFEFSVSGNCVLSFTVVWEEGTNPVLFERKE